MVLIIIIALISVVLAGTLLAFYLRKQSKDILPALLAFSGAFLLGIAVLHVLPEVYEQSIEYVGYFILAGFLVQMILESFTKGLEHGHIHPTKKAVPVALFLGLFLHAYMEAIPLVILENTGESTTEVTQHGRDHHHHSHDHRHTHTDIEGTEDTDSTNSNEDHQNALLYGVLIHKLPIAFALTIFMLASGFSSRKTILWVGIFTAAAPLGVLTGTLIEDTKILFYLLAIALGSFFHVSTTIIMESGKNHKLSMKRLMVVLVGFGLAALSAGFHVH